MIKLLFTLVFLTLFLGQYSFAQNKIGRVCFLVEDKKLYDWSCLEQKATKKDSTAAATLNTLLKPLGLHSRFIMRECSEIENFAALISEKSHLRYIIYNKAIIDSIADPLNRHWNEIAIYLHELAHHLNGDTSNPNDSNSLEEELHADEFSGVQMAKLNATLVQAQRFLTGTEDTPCDDDAYTHPCLEKRLNAVAKGWYEGMGLTTFYESVSSKNFDASVTTKDFSADHHLRPESPFEHNHCIRSLKPCNCKVIINEIYIKIDLKDQSSSLTLELTDKGDYANGKCDHGKLDTTIVIKGYFYKHVDLLPAQKISIDYPMGDYDQKLRFQGLLLKSGIISGEITSPNEHGVSFAPIPNQKGIQYIGNIILTSKQSNK